MLDLRRLHKVLRNMAVPEDTGYPVKWFKNQEYVRDMWECAVCLEVVKDTVQIRGCGHQFCRYCLDNVLKNQPQCPTCRNDISEETVFDDKAANRGIGKLEVNCPNNGCEWDGSLNYLLGEHAARCPFTVLNCRNVGCDMKIIRKDLVVYLTKCEHRTVVCELCTSEHVFKDKAAHLQTCTHLPVECINKCSLLGKVPRNKMEAHTQTTCPKTVIKCKYSEFGCKRKCQRYKMRVHLKKKTNKHLDLSMMEISRLKRVTATTSVIKSIISITDFNRKLSKLAKEENMLGRIEGDPFYTSPHGYKLRMLVALNETRQELKGHMGVYICVMKSDHDAILSWPFKKTCTFTLIDQQDNEGERKNIVRTLIPEDEDEFKRPIKKENVGLGFGNFVSHATLQTRKYIKDDTVFITVSIGP